MESVLDRVIKQNTENVNLLKTKDYNIFSVLQIQSKEVLICRMIADLLNPRGQHGAGAEYLKIFLRDCLGMEKMDTKLADQAIVTAEYAIDDERRIDIVIEMGSYFLPIEVKIYAADQKSQCFDYYQYAKRRDAQAKVYYLTLDGHRPGKDSTSSGSQSVPEEDIVCLSFREHILNWLKACKSCENTGMVPILEQFIQNIEQISGYTSEKVRNMVIDELLKSGDCSPTLSPTPETAILSLEKGCGRTGFQCRFLSLSSDSMCDVPKNCFSSNRGKISSSLFVENHNIIPGGLL